MAALDTPGKRLQWAREQHGQYSKPTEAARAFGWPVSTYLGHENGDRAPSRPAAIRYAKTYRVRWEWLLEGHGPATLKAESVKLVGALGAHSEIDFYPEPRVGKGMELPPSASSLTVAIELAGAPMRTMSSNGWLIYFDDEKLPPKAELVGRLCVVAVHGGKALVKTLQPGRKRGRYDLESPPWAIDATLRDCRVAWAAPVLWIKPR